MAWDIKWILPGSASAMYHGQMGWKVKSYLMLNGYKEMHKQGRVDGLLSSHVNVTLSPHCHKMD